ncbi:hypothetical protein LTR27_002528 [Elasticomyces elasticus]|nr:hypothetical protein LTR27_002528 [Elasticomyces elasticus]
MEQRWLVRQHDRGKYAKANFTGTLTFILLFRSHAKCRLPLFTSSSEVLALRILSPPSPSQATASTAWFPGSNMASLPLTTIASALDNGKPKQPTGFFDLPLELRQQICEEMLPEDKVFTYGLTKLRWSQERTIRAQEVGYAAWERERREWAIHATIKTDPRFGPEIKQWAEKQRCTFRFVFSPNSLPPPSPDQMRYDKLPTIEIFLDGYDMNDVDKSVDEIAKKLRAFVVMLNRYKKLRAVMITFRDAGGPLQSRRLWCTPQYVRRPWGYDEQWSLAILHRSGAPVVTYLLMQLQGLPPCRFAAVNWLELDYVNEGVLGEAYDLMYMADAFDAVGNYLEGDRKRASISNPVHQLSRECRGQREDLQDPRKYPLEEASKERYKYRLIEHTLMGHASIGLHDRHLLNLFLVDVDKCFWETSRSKLRPQASQQHAISY